MKGCCSWTRVSATAEVPLRDPESGCDTSPLLFFNSVAYLLLACGSGSSLSEGFITHTAASCCRCIFQ